MTKRVYVTKAQELAAATIIERSRTSGKEVRPGVVQIASAAAG